MLPAQRRNWQRTPGGEAEALSDVWIFLHELSEPVGLLRGLIDPRPPVHNVNESTRQRPTDRPCNQPDGHHGGLPHTCRKIDDGRDFTSVEPLKEILLPWERAVVSAEAQCIREPDSN